MIIFFLLVIVLTGLTATLVGVHLIGDRILKQAQKKVKLDLNTAREIYNEKTREIETSIRLTALRFFIKNAIVKQDIQSLENEFKKISKVESLDFLTLTDKNGTVLLRANNPKLFGDSQANDEILEKVIDKEKIVSATQIFSEKELSLENEELPEQARIELIKTPKARKRLEQEETSGMIIKAAAPIFDYEGKLIGVLYGGVLLNRNFELVDKIKDIVYRRETYKGKDIGTATIFQNDLRISTNVETIGGERAIGTRVSEEVYNQVLIKGNPWIHRAFVVNNWYITAYEPIRNIKDELIGILYVGILEEEFTDMKRDTLWTFLGITFAGVIVSFIISYFLGNSIIRPIKCLVTASHHLASGDLNHRVECKSKDEFAELGSTFNFMVDSIKERDQKLLEYTKRKIMESERLAIVGQLAAGVAHEINNPLGSILIYSSLILEDLPENSPEKENLQKIVKQTTRCKGIVRGLLDFSRQTEPEMKQDNIHHVIEDVLSLVKNQSLFLNVKITKKYDLTIPNIMFDKAKIQQVFVNILLNAVESMEGQGELTIETCYSTDKKFINVNFTDTGYGIRKENIKKIFDPFFSASHKPYSTGLGLSISYGIIKKHKGNISVVSKVGEGSTFVISLPIEEQNG
jgi:two-component system NtrC family sensor kinase